MFEELEFGRRKPTDSEVRNALIEDNDDLDPDRRWLILEMASPKQLDKIRKEVYFSDGGGLL